MKKLIICLFLLSFSTHAGYMSKLDMLDCDKKGRTVYLRLQSCIDKHADCRKVPKNFQCETHAEIDGKIIEEALRKAAYDADIEANLTAQKATNDSLKLIRAKAQEGTPLNANEIGEALKYLLQRIK